VWFGSPLIFALNPALLRSPKKVNDDRLRIHGPFILTPGHDESEGEEAATKSTQSFLVVLGHSFIRKVESDSNPLDLVQRNLILGAII
jgi:hypothetical protein